MHHDAILLRRPGYFDLTEFLINYASLASGEAVLDVGCGCGATVAFLREEYSLMADGIDLQLPEDTLCPEALRQGDVHCLSQFFPAECYAAVISECCLSLFDKTRQALEQMYYVLQHNGWLLLSDIYLFEEGESVSQPPYLYSKKQLTQLLSKLGFEVIHFEDHRRLLQTWFGQSIFDLGRAQFWTEYGCHIPKSNYAKLSYYTLAARKVT